MVRRCTKYYSTGNALFAARSASLLGWRNDQSDDDHDHTTTTANGRHDHEKRRNGRKAAGGLALCGPSAEGPVGTNVAKCECQSCLCFYILGVANETLIRRHTATAT